VLKWGNFAVGPRSGGGLGGLRKAPSIFKPPAPLVRECRYFSAAPELRPAEAGGKVKWGALPRVRGYAALFNTRSEDMGFGEYSLYEEIRPGAFDNLSYENVVALFNHDQNLPLARSGAGLQLGVDTRGLWYEFELPDTSIGRDLGDLLKRGSSAQKERMSQTMTIPIS